MAAELLVIAWGNRLRGDDALGPMVLDALLARIAGTPLAEQVDGLELPQLQIEQVDDLRGRRAVLFIDADRTATDGPRWIPLPPLAQATPAHDGVFSHAASVPALWALARHCLVDGAAAPAPPQALRRTDVARLAGPQAPAANLRGAVLGMPITDTTWREPLQAPSEAQAALIEAATGQALRWLQTHQV